MVVNRQSRMEGAMSKAERWRGVWAVVLPAAATVAMLALGTEAACAEDGCTCTYIGTGQQFSHGACFQSFCPSGQFWQCVNGEWTDCVSSCPSLEACISGN